ncbi:hypothetical protein KC19_5G135000 [Ceratodon purpureus]|uniref:Uncharacterized protein n=1 Tax=Ceratodon purpureus TaxID=3225 RepID=A0A8T0I2X8_CERPU|nr:hypothetical protein KC19_5G135000 [Ceratodon purpureus]
MATSLMTQVIETSAIKLCRKASNAGLMTITAREEWGVSAFFCRPRPIKVWGLDIPPR